MSATIPALNERYRIERPIGKGGMATVYLGWDELLHRQVAIKVLSAAHAADRSFVERFKREARAMANLTHPHIVAIFDWDEHDETYFMVMEYVAGRTLKSLTVERGPLPEAEVLAIGAQIASALEAAHEHDVVHRDIKPQNVLISPDSQVKVADFGIARVAGTSNLTTPQNIMGTVQYLSPEQVLQQEIDGRADLYSLGVVLYEMLTGVVPFAGDTVAAIAMQHVHATPRPVRARRPEISVRTEAIVQKALAKEPERRYRSAAEFRAALEQAAEALAAPHATTVPLVIPAPREPARDVPLNAPWRMRGRLPLPGRWLAVLPLLLCLVLLMRVGGAIGASLLAVSAPRVASASASMVSGTPTISVIAPAATTATATVRPMSPTVALFTRLESPLPSIPNTMPPPTLAPSATPTMPPPPTATVVPTAPPPTATPQEPTPTPGQRIIVQASRPQEAVLAFYQLVASHRFDVATALWSPQMQAQNPPDQAINGRYAQTDRIIVQRWEVTEQTADRATVAFIISEYAHGDSTPQRYQGAWHLVHTEVGWLLDSEDVQPA